MKSKLVGDVQPVDSQIIIDMLADAVLPEADLIYSVTVEYRTTHMHLLKVELLRDHSGELMPTRIAWSAP